MLKKGLIDPRMNDDELQQFLREETGTDRPKHGEPNKKGAEKGKVTPRTVNPGRESLSSDSEITIYKRAVK